MSVGGHISLSFVLIFAQISLLIVYVVRLLDESGCIAMAFGLEDWIGWTS